MTSKTKRLSSIALVAAVAVLAAVALSGAAAADTTTLAGDGTDHTTGFNASEGDHFEYTLNSDGTDFGTDDTDTVVLNMTVNDEHVEVSNASVSSTASSYTFNVSHSELGTIPGEAGTNTTVTVNAWGENSTDGSVNTSVDTFDMTLEFHEDYTVVYAGDTAAAGDLDDREVETADEDGILASVPGFSADKQTSIEADNVGLGDNASGTTVHVVVANQSGEDTFGAADDKRFGSFDEGDFMDTHVVEIEGHTQAVFKSDAPTDDLADDYTFAETSERNGHDAYSIEVDDDYEGESNVDVSATVNGDYGFGLGEFSTKRDAFGGSIAALTAGLFLVVGMRRREA